MFHSFNAEPIVEGLTKSLTDFEKSYLDTIQDIINKDPFCGHDFYIFSVFKLKDRTMINHKYLHQPTIMRPIPIPGSSCLKVNMNTKQTVLIWTLPLDEFMGDFAESMFDHPNPEHKKFVLQCIKDYKSGKLMPKYEDDPSNEEIKEIVRSMEIRAKENKLK
jgi:hypothetical protein